MDLPATPKWQPLSRNQRRVVGVLVEKSKTTPDLYPMTLNAITTGCNQKSNRSPITNLDQDEVQKALDQLRPMGAVVEVRGDGRVPKYRHQLYEWLGVDKVELAVMAELLLRGHQTMGELRTRASRMESISDLPALRPIVDSLLEKNLMIELTPAGRGQIVSHNLYQPEELEKIRRALPGESAEDDDEYGVAIDSGTENRVTDRSQLRRDIDALQQRMEELELKFADLAERLEIIQK